MEYVLYLLLALLVLLLMITIHEFGHYIAGKILKFKINEFSIGFGPKLFSKKKKNGEVFSIRAIPLGGFCAFDGEDEADDLTDRPPAPHTEVFEETAAAPEAVKPTAQNENAPDNAAVSDTVATETAVVGETAKDDYIKFNDQKPWKRIIVLLAGGVFNLLSAVLFSFIFLLSVGVAYPRIAYVYEADLPIPLMVGDYVKAVNGQEITVLRTYEEIMSSLDGLKVGDEATITVIRNGEEIEFTIIKQHIEKVSEKESPYDGFGIKIGPGSLSQPLSFGKALLYCVPYTGELAWSVLGALGQLITGSVPVTEVSGPIGTIDLMARLTLLGARNILLLIPLIAANLGVMNLLPIPALDGSKVVFAIIEWIRKKPLNRKVEAIIHAVGMIVLFTLIIGIDIFGMISRCGACV